MRECTLATLDTWVTAVQLDKMVTIFFVDITFCIRYDIAFNFLSLEIMLDVAKAVC